MTDTSSATPVLFDVANSIACLTPNRPAVGNAIDLPMARALVNTAIRCQTDEAMRCVVVTGAGRLFCAGGDVTAFRTAGDDIGPLLSELAGTLPFQLEETAIPDLRPRELEALILVGQGKTKSWGFLALQLTSMLKVLAAPMAKPSVPI